MPRFEPFTETTSLPAVGDGYERAMLDFKAKGETKSAFHLAKDVAAFANHLGGTLLIGAREEGGRVARYLPLTAQEAKGVQDAVSAAVGNRLSPKPIVDFAQLPVDAGVVLAVNVSPYIGQAIGVRVIADKAKEGFGDDAYVFPVRTLTDTIYLLPGQLSMFMLPAIRRTVILLHSIPRGAAVHVVAIATTGNREEGFMTIEGVDEATNSVHLLPTPPHPDHKNRSWQLTFPVSYPLDLISSVYLLAERGQHWRIFVRAWHG
jgi:Putative DNA-binding domain